MTARGLIYFLIAFGTVVVLGLLTGCASSDDYHNSRYSKGHAFVSYCGMERCDGKPNR